MAAHIKVFAASVVASLLTIGCSLYSNTDRQNFNAQAVRQIQTSSAACALRIGGALDIMCFEANSATTIVRVSR